MANIAIMGFGTVGAGVWDVLRQNADEIASRAFGERLTVTRILDLRDFTGDAAPLLTHSFDDVLNDESITIIAETMGGLNPAYPYVKALLTRGKSVVTSNKELVAVHGPELMRLSAERGCRFLFEASVCGGVPIIRTITNALTADRITAISGILNGTTNFILSKMTREGVGFAEALAEAQRLRFAERDPSADVDGLDARRKIAILASLAAERHVPDGLIPTEGIRAITEADIACARKLGMTIKLLALARIGEGVEACVAPFLVPQGDLYANVRDEYNAARIYGNCLGDVALYGKGAGKMATGSAVVSNIVDAARGPRARSPRLWPEESVSVTDAGAGAMRRMVRLKGAVNAAAFGGADIIEHEGDMCFIAPAMREAELSAKLSGLPVVKTIRVYEGGL